MRATNLEAEKWRWEFAQVNLGGKNIYMCSLLDLDNPIELAFMARTPTTPLSFLCKCWAGFLHKHLDGFLSTSWAASE